MKIIVKILLFVIFYYSLIAEDYNSIVKSGTPFILNQRNLKINDVQVDYYRPSLQVSYESPNGYFLIHFDTIGTNAVDLSDINKNGVPDYIDSVAFYFDFAYDVQVNDFGMLSPIPDSGKGGTDAYDIYVLDIGNGELYETFYGVTFNDLVIFPQKKFDRFTAFTVIDNNYSAFDSTIIDSSKKIQTYQTSGIEALRLTATHELNHAIQFRYGVSPYDFDLIAEMSSVAIEKLTFPESKDYLKYVNDLIRNYKDYVFSEPNYINGYRYGIFIIYLAEKYETFELRKVWENIGKGLLSYEALNEVISEQNSDLNNEFCSFIYDLFEASKNKYSSYLVDAQYFHNPISNTIETFGVVNYFDGNTKNYQINYISLIDSLSSRKDSIDFIFSMQDYESLISKKKKKYNFSLIIRKGYDEGFVKLDGVDYYYNLSNSNFYCVNYFLETKTFITDEVISFPSPFKLNINNKIYFSLPKNFDENLAKLIIYDNSFNVLVEKVLPVSFRGNFKVVELDGLPADFGPGIYLFSTGGSKNKYFGKFVVVK